MEQNQGVPAGGSCMGRVVQAGARGVWNQEVGDDGHHRGQFGSAGRYHREHRGRKHADMKHTYVYCMWVCVYFSLCVHVFIYLRMLAHL